MNAILPTVNAALAAHAAPVPAFEPRDRAGGAAFASLVEDMGQGRNAPAQPGAAADFPPSPAGDAANEAAGAKARPSAPLFRFSAQGEPSLQGTPAQSVPATNVPDQASQDTDPTARTPAGSAGAPDANLAPAPQAHVDAEPPAGPPPTPSPTPRAPTVSPDHPHIVHAPPHMPTAIVPATDVARPNPTGPAVAEEETLKIVSTDSVAPASRPHPAKDDAPDAKPQSDATQAPPPPAPLPQAAPDAAAGAALPAQPMQPPPLPRVSPPAPAEAPRPREDAASKSAAAGAAASTAPTPDRMPPDSARPAPAKSVARDAIVGAAPPDRAESPPAVRNVRAATWRAPTTTLRGHMAAALAHLGAAPPSAQAPDDEPGVTRTPAAAPALKPPAPDEARDAGLLPDANSPLASGFAEIGGFQEKLNLLGAQPAAARLPENAAVAEAERTIGVKDQPAPEARTVKTLDVELAGAGADPLAMKMRLAGGRLSVVIEAPNAHSVKEVEAIRHDISQQLGVDGRLLESLVIRQSHAPGASAERSDAGAQRQGEPRSGSGGAQDQPQGSGRRSLHADRGARQGLRPHRRPDGDLVV
jgi:hypothetical protein